MASASLSSPAVMIRSTAYNSSSGLSIIVVLVYLHLPMTITILTLDPEFDSSQIHDFKAFYINVLQVVPHVSRLPFLPIRVRGIFSYLLAMKWIVSIPMYHQLSNSGLAWGGWSISLQRASSSTIKRSFSSVCAAL